MTSEYQNRSQKADSLIESLTNVVLAKIALEEKPSALSLANYENNKNKFQTILDIYIDNRAKKIIYDKNFGPQQKPNWKPEEEKKEFFGVD
jgi:hypothetical protein